MIGTNEFDDAGTNDCVGAFVCALDCGFIVTLELFVVVVEDVVLVVGWIDDAFVCSTFFGHTAAPDEAAVVVAAEDVVGSVIYENHTLCETG